MNSSFLKKAVPHLIAAGFFLLLAIIYCQPALTGKVVNQHDQVGWRGMAQQSFEYKEKYGHFPLWTNSVFAGMPTYNIAMEAKYGNPVGMIYYIVTLGLPKPANYFFMACLAFYFLCIVMRIRPWLAVMAAIGFAYSSYSAIIISAGHETKMQAMSVAPIVIGAVMLLYEKKYLWGLALLTIFFGIEIGTQHLQIVYYTFLTLGFFTIGFLIKSIKENKIKDAGIGVALAIAGGLIGFGTYAVSLLPMQDYAKETMRGGRSELKPLDSANATKGGLNKDYAFDWSYGIGETMTLIVPGVYGGSNGGREHKAPTKFTETLTDIGYPEDYALSMVNGYSYWGQQRNTSGPVYLGAVLCFLFIFGMVFLRSWHKWWILAAVIFAIILAWGKNFPAVNNFLFDYMPFYNKFRAPTMSLVIPQMLVPLLSALAVDRLLNAQVTRDQLMNKLKVSVFITAGVFVIIGLLYVWADFSSPRDGGISQNIAYQVLQAQSRGQQPTAEMQQQATSIGQSAISALQSDRQSLFTRDAFRSLILILLAAGLLWAYIRNTIKELPLVIGLLVLTMFDLFMVDIRYLRYEDYVAEEKLTEPLAETPADKEIRENTTFPRPFRVLDLSDEGNGPFQSSRGAYFHNSVGGYHPAKLGLYQDLIDRQISNNNEKVLDMLNTRYFIANNRETNTTMAIPRPSPFGPAWLAGHVTFVKTADDEMDSLNNVGRDTAYIQERFKDLVTVTPQPDSTASITVKEYLNDKITYESNSATNQFAVFSEIYYPRGWKAFVDGKETEIVKTNYLLRGLPLTAGKHNIEFRFEPAAYNTGNTVMLICSIIAFALLAAAIFFSFRKKSH